MPAYSPLLLRHSSLPFARLQTPKTPQTLQFLRGSFHQAWPSAFAAPGLQPALCLHIPRGSFHQAPGRQRSSIAACPLPAHSPLLLGPSSLPFARLQTPKTPKMPKTLLCLHIALSCYGIRACRLPGFKPLKALQPLKLRGSFHQAWPSAFAAPGLQPALCLHIPRGSFHQAPGRQRSSIAACPLPAHSPLLLGHSSLPFARLQTPKMSKTLLCLHIALSCYGIRACRLPGFKPLKPLKPSNSFAAASTKPAFAAPGLQPALCLHIPRGSFHQAPGRQHSSIAACPLPAHSPLLLGPSSLPFARLQTPKTPKMPKTLLCLHIALSCYGIRACRLPGFKPLKALQPLKLRGSFHQAWPSAFAAPGLQPALCLHIPRGSFHQAPGRQRSSIAACPLPAHSPLLLGHSSLPFARLQTPKMPKTLLCLHIALSCYGIRACRLPGFKPLKPLKPSNSFAAASTKPGRRPLLLQGCSLPFACTSRAAASTKLLAVSVPALQPALCLHIALSC